MWGPGEGGTQLDVSTGSKLAESTIEGAPHRSYVQEWNLTVQRQLATDLSVTLGYVGSHGVHLMMRGDDGNMTGAPGSTTNGISTAEVATPYGYLFPGATQGGNAVQQVNQTMGVIRYIYWNTGSNYNALNVNIDKKFAKGYQFQIAYTYSKSLDDDSQTIAGDTFANGINSPWWWLPKAFYGPSDFNVTHTLSINALYTIPTPKSWNGAMKEALADWEVGGIFTFNSGTPTTVINNGDPLNLGNSGADQFGPVVKIPGCNPVNSNWIGGVAPVYINQNCFATIQRADVESASLQPQVRVRCVLGQLAPSQQPSNNGVLTTQRTLLAVRIHPRTRTIAPTSRRSMSAATSCTARTS